MAGKLPRMQLELCRCDLRDRRWNPNTNRCEGCGCTFTNTTPPNVLADGSNLGTQDSQDPIALASALRSVLAIIERTGGHMFPQDQTVLRAARALVPKR